MSFVIGVVALILFPGKVSWAKDGLMLIPWWKVLFLETSKIEIKKEEKTNE